MNEKLKDMSKKQILKTLSLEQLKDLAKKWWGLKSPYKTAIIGKKLKTKKDFINYFMTRIYTKTELIKNIKKQATLTIGMKRDLERKRGFKCEACDRSTKNFKPDIHHIQAVDEGGSSNRDNLIILCPTCHRIAHTYKGKLSKIELKKYIKKIRKKE